MCSNYANEIRLKNVYLSYGANGQERGESAEKERERAKGKRIHKTKNIQDAKEERKRF